MRKPRNVLTTQVRFRTWEECIFTFFIYATYFSYNVLRFASIWVKMIFFDEIKIGIGSNSDVMTMTNDPSACKLTFI